MNGTNALEIGDRIKSQRLLMGYTREELAEKIDITPRFCYDLELGLKKMSISTLCKLAVSLNVSTDFILFGPQSEDERYTNVISALTSCPSAKLEHLEQIISHYIQAIRE